MPKHRKRKRSGGQGGSSKSPKQRSKPDSSAGTGGHRERRKLARKESRRLRKLSKKLGVGVSLRSEEYGTHTAEVESRTRESFTRHRALRKRLSVCNVDRQLEKESNRLQHWVSEEDKSAYEKEVAKKKSTLKGAARPAREVYPWLYPSGKGTGNGVQPPAERNLLEEFKGNLAGHEETRLYLLLHYERASRLMENMEVEQAYRLFQGVEEMDRSGSLAGLITQKIVQGFIEKGDLLEAREMLEGRKKWRTASPFLAWDLVLVEYISRHVLKETESSEALEVALKEAMRVEPGIGHILAKHESYEEHVAMYAAQDEKEVELQIKESFLRSGKVPSFHVLDTPERYFHRSVSWWRDADGVFEFLQKAVQSNAAEETAEN